MDLLKTAKNDTSLKPLMEKSDITQNEKELLPKLFLVIQL